MASVEKRSRNGRTRWYVRYRDPEGKQRSRTFDRKVDADRFVIGTEHAKLSGGYVDPGRGRVTVGDWAEQWLAGKLGLAPKTRERYEGILTKQVVPRWADVALADVSHAEVQKWVAGLDLAPASVHKIYRVLSMILDSAVADGRLSRNPAAKIELPRVIKGVRRYLTHEQVAELAKRVGDDYRLIVLFLAYTGVRWGEMAALRLGRLDLDRRRAMIYESVTPVKGVMSFGTTKNAEHREVPIPAFLVPMLRAHVAGKAKDDLVFRGPRGAVARSGKFQLGALNAAAIEMGLCDFGDDGKPVAVFHPHELRHTAASLAIAAGADIKVVQTMLGHSSATMTLDLYGHLMPDRLDQVADAMDAARTVALGTHRVHIAAVNDHPTPMLANDVS